MVETPHMRRERALKVKERSFHEVGGSLIRRPFDELCAPAKCPNYSSSANSAKHSSIGSLRLSVRRRNALVDSFITLRFDSHRLQHIITSANFGLFLVCWIGLRASNDWEMESQTFGSGSGSGSGSFSGRSSSTSYPKKRKSDLLKIIKSATCLVSSSADTGKGQSKLSNNKLRHGFHLVEGKSGHDMEDYHVAEYRYENNHELGLFAIFDGHLGDAVPTYLKDNLFNNILREPIFWTDPQAAIKHAYLLTNKFILENSTQLGPGGSTAVTAVVVDGKDLWIANVGDSRAVLCERGEANQITVDHEPDVERRNIEKRGGFVTLFPGDVPRVNGQLAVARAFGDQSLKAQLSSEPDVRHVPIDSSIEFVILASDGLWKVIKNHEAVNLIKSIRNPQSAAKRLTTEALARRSSDDISCIVIRFSC